MAATFSRTTRSLQTDRSRPVVVDLLLAALVVAWAAWFVFGQVTVYEVTDKARLEVKSAAHPVASPVLGQVVQTRLAIGRQVTAGEVLVVFDAEAQRRAIQEKRTRLATLAERLVALRRQLETEQEAIGVEDRARAVALDEQHAQIEQAEAAERFARREVESLAPLYRRSMVSALEFRKARTEATKSQAAARAQRLGVSRLEQDRLVQAIDRKARLAKLQREAVDLEKEAVIEEAAMGRLEHDLALRTIRAPVSGRVGEVVAFPVGSVVRAAERLATIVPPGQPHAVAWFPVTGVGRLCRGQPARLRLSGFPWTQYGTLPATVTDVGNEASEGRIRVEFSLDAAALSSVPLEHGLPGAAEVEVERVAPAILVLRAAGQFLRVGRRAEPTGSDRVEP
jgi:membrane fusion protein (multidrug efflux system)